MMHIHLARCNDCRYGECRVPPTPHTWGDAEDFAWAEHTGQPPPGVCACPCAHPTPKVVVRSEALDLLSPPFKPNVQIWRWTCPDCEDGTASEHADALEEALKHRWSADCKHRKGDKS